MAAPDFTLPDTQNTRRFHLADYKGRAVFVAFVPTWTDAKTVAEVRSLAASVPHFDAAGAKVMVVSGDAPENAAALQARENLPFPLLSDTNNALAKQYDVPQGSPFRTTFVVDPAAKIKFRLGDAVVETGRHGQQLLDVSKCCIDDVMAARAHGVGKAVGDFSLLRAGSGAIEPLLGGDQKATVILFLSVQCPCSNAYNARIAALAKTLSDKPVRLVGVYSNQDETAQQIVAHAKKNGFTFPIYKDERALCADHLGASLTPEVFVVDSRHVLQYAGRIDTSRDPAEVTSHDLADAVESVVAGRQPKQKDTHAFGCAIVRADSVASVQPVN